MIKFWFWCESFSDLFLLLLPGAYSTEVDAAKAHDLVSIRIGGLKALTNCHVCFIHYRCIYEFHKYNLAADFDSIVIN